MDRSQPPMASLCVWKIHQRYPDDRKFLAETYPKLVLWHDWWLKYRNAMHDGLLEWGSSNGGFQDAQFETGWDDNLHYAGAHMRGSTMDAYSIDLSSMWSMDTKYLALMAGFLGHASDAARFRSEHAAMNRRINARLWNSNLNVYCSRFWDDPAARPALPSNPGVFLTRLTPMNFYPLSAGVPDRARAQLALQVLTDPKKFWGQYLLPTLAYDDPDYHQQEYWRGDVWAPVNYIVWQGIKQYASPAQITEFADRSVELFMKNWVAQGVCSENYLSTDGTWNHDPHYTWGALLDLIGVESIVDVDDSGKIVLNGAQNKNITLKNIPLLGRTYDVKTTPGKAELFRDGKLMLTAKGNIVRAAIR
jgi:glycogen debranching enzyme